MIHDYRNIEHRDAVLAYDDVEPMTDAAGSLVTRWDGVTFKTHPATGEPVPDEAAQVPQWRYLKPQQAAWPAADFIVGNPPFIGASTMRVALGDGYVEALRRTWPEVPESADFVMYWWHRAALTVRSGASRRFGFITTNSLRQTFNRRVVQAALEGSLVRSELDGTLHARRWAGSGERTAGVLMKHPKSAPSSPHPTAGGLSLLFVIPDHPWVDSANGAAVRIAMTVAGRRSDFSSYDVPDVYCLQNVYAANGRLLQVVEEKTGSDGSVDVKLTEQWGEIHADLRIGADITMAVPLLSNAGMSSPGVKLHGAGFIVTSDEATALGLGTVPGLERYIREYRNGRDLTGSPRGVKVIDLFGLSAEKVRSAFPAVYQRLSERVKPERDAKGTTKDGAGYAAAWWLFGKPRQKMRKQLVGLPRYIATVETAKHRTFQFLDASILPDNMLIAIASDDALHLGVLSSSVHVPWALATGGRLGLGNDPRYNKSRCFETFPFPDQDAGLTPDLADRIRVLAEQIDAHRKKQQAAHPDITLTGMYNVLEKLRSGETLTAKEKVVNEQGLVGVLLSLHNELDDAVLAAYGWSDLNLPADTETLLERLVALNARRAAEEATGIVRWLRPEFQQRGTAGEQTEMEVTTDAGKVAATAKPSTVAPLAKRAWPAGLPEQIKTVAEVLSASAQALTLTALEAHFTARGRWRKRLPTILETLEALGRARHLASKPERWQAI